MIKDAEKIRAYRLHAHHLDEKVPPSGLWEAAGACGLQNSPPCLILGIHYKVLTRIIQEGLSAS